MTSDEQKPYHLPSRVSDFLNLARGISAQLVLFGHAISFLGIFPLLQPPSTPYLQNIGVVLFFFISGIVIAYTVETKSATLPQFLFERSTRIFTALVPALLFVALIDQFFLKDDHYSLYAQNSSIKTLIGNVLMLAEYPSFRIGGYSISLSPISVDRFGTMRPVWSVLMEFWLYIFFGSLFLYKTVKSKFAIALCAVLFVFSILPVLAGFTNGKGSGLSIVWLLGAIYYRTILKTDLLRHHLPAVFFGLLISLAVLVYGRSMMSVSEQGYDLRYSLAICFSLALAIEVYRHIPVADILRRAIQNIGEFLASYSFSLYLIHYTVLAPIPIWLDAEPRSFGEKVGALIVFFLISNLVAYGFYWVFESRYRAVRGLLSRKPSPDG